MIAGLLSSPGTCWVSGVQHVAYGGMARISARNTIAMEAGFDEWKLVQEPFLSAGGSAKNNGTESSVWFGWNCHAVSGGRAYVMGAREDFKDRA